MGKPCFKARDSNPPECGVHGALLTLTTVPIDRNAPNLGMVRCLVCPLTKQVVSEP
jgi:hypothetical protein